VKKYSKTKNHTQAPILILTPT